jgi:predicted outer membrane repeat protein
MTHSRGQTISGLILVSKWLTEFVRVKKKTSFRRRRQSQSYVSRIEPLCVRLLLTASHDILISTGANLVGNGLVTFPNGAPATGGTAITFGSPGANFAKLFQVSLGTTELQDSIDVEISVTRLSVDFDPKFMLTDGVNMYGAAISDDNGGSLYPTRFQDLVTRGVYDGSDDGFQNAGFPAVGGSMIIHLRFTFSSTSSTLQASYLGSTTSFTTPSQYIDPTRGLSFAMLRDNESVESYQINSIQIVRNGDAALTAEAFTPVNGAGTVSPKTDLSLTFNRNVNKGTGSILLKRLIDGSIAQAIDVTSSAVTVSGATVTINPVDLDESTGYYVEIPSTAFTDQSGSFYAGISGGGTWNFTTASAAHIVVTSLLDNTNESDGLTTLREAINLANSNGTTDEISFAAGLNGTLSLTLGQMPITESVTITGNGAANTVIDAQQLSRHFYLSGTTTSVTLDGLALRNGRTTIDGRSLPSGETGSSDGEGGAIHSIASGMLTIQNCLITDNSTTGYRAYGGAVYVYDGDISIVNSAFSTNFTTGYQGHGGAILVSKGTASIARSTFTGNTGLIQAHGGAICVIVGSVSVSTSRFNGNAAIGQGGSGGAIAGFRDVSVNDSVFDGNTAKSAGGAVYGADNICVTSCEFSSNSATGIAGYGGAIAGAHHPVFVTNSTLSGNSTTGTFGDGGAIWTYSGAVTVSNSTIVGNTTSAAGTQGGGIFTFDGATITTRNSIVAQNTDAAGTNPDIRVSGPLFVQNSLIGNNLRTPLAEDQTGTSGNFIGTQVNPIDPLLGPLQDNGGPTLTHAPLRGSLAINSGSNALAVDPASGNAVLTTDQRGAGFARITQGVVDMGAIDVDPVFWTTGIDGKWDWNREQPVASWLVL